jgi:hypothetical protein
MPSFVALSKTEDKAAHRAAVEFMLMDRDLAHGADSHTVYRYKELADELEKTFGPDALENSASYFTGGHFSPDDIVIFAAIEWETLKQVFAGVQF